MSDTRSVKTARRVQSPLLTEVAALLLVPAAAVGFIRIFEAPSDFFLVALAGIASSLLALILRRIGVPLILAAPLSLLALLAVLLNALAPGTTRFLLVPTEETRAALDTIATTSLEVFRTQRAPVEAIDGFLAAAAAGAWLAAFIVDWAALRLRLAFEPVLPAGLLFIFTAVTGSGKYQVISTAIFASSIVLWTVANRLAKERHLLWLTADRHRGPARVAGGAAAFSAVAVAAGLVAGPLLPGAGNDELFDWRNGGDPTRVVVSPFVSIGSRLVEQRDVDLFKVTTDRPSYYRLAGLDTFEGGDWVSRGQNAVNERGGTLPGQRPTSGSTQVVNQQFEIQALSGDWAPAAYAPANIIASDVQFSWIAETGSLITDGSVSSVSELTYELESVVPLYTSEELRNASTEAPPEIAARYLSIPEDISPLLAEVATSVTAGGATDYDRLILLQDYFQAFDYSLDLGAAAGDPIEQFLSERRGFCQQFSGTFALMARALNIPSRVAVGFTWGDPVPGQPGVYQITGRHTHAWPEVYFADLGWVAFEPTPQRGSPAATGYANLPARQDSESQPDSPFAATTTTTPPTGQGGSSLPERPFRDPDLAEGGPSVGVGASSGVSLPLRWIAVAFAAICFVVGLPLIQRLRRHRRWLAAGNPADQVNAAWADVTEAIERQYGILRLPSETRATFCDQLADRYPFRALPMHAFGVLATTARYAPDQVTADAASSAKTHADAILGELHADQSPVRRWWQEADPRRLVRPTVRLRTR